MPDGARRISWSSRRRKAVAAAAFTLVATGAAHAQDGPYTNYLVGEHALGLAGAFVAVADDPSAGFHNPGGIGALTESSAAGSVVALSLRSRVLDGGYATPVGAGDLDYDATPGVPVFLAAVVKLGSRGADGVRAHSLGVSLLTPYRDDYRVIGQIEGNDPDLGTPAVDRLEVRHHDRAQWYGLSYGVRFSARFALGLSTFVATRSIGHDEVEIRGREGIITDLPPDTNQSRSATVDASSEHGVLRVGALWDASHDVRLGLMLQPPGLELGARASHEQLTAHADPDEVGFEIVERNDVKTHLPLPWEVRTGVSWRDPPLALLTLDISVLGPSGSASDPMPLVERPAGDQATALFVPEIAYREIGVRTAVGFEVLIDEVVPLRGGVLVERSSAPEVPLLATRYVRERVHTLGGAFSVGVRSGAVDMSIGVTGLYGVGEGLGVERGAPGQPVAYASRDVHDATLLVFVTGARQAVKSLVQEVTREGPDEQDAPKLPVRGSRRTLRAPPPAAAEPRPVSGAPSPVPEGGEEPRPAPTSAPPAP